MTQIYTEITGREFNALHNHAGEETKTKFYKFLNDNLTHNDFVYKLGLNIDIIPFRSKESCSSGGLYFCEESECHLYWDNYGSKLAIVEIPDDARVYIENHKFKADKIIITEIINFEDIKDKFWIDNIFPYCYDAIEFIGADTQKIHYLELQNNGRLSKFVY